MKRIVWDWNGTLLDDVDLSFQCINRLLKANDLEPLCSLDAYRNVFDFPIQSYYEKVGFDFSKKSYATLAQSYMEDYQQKSYDCDLTDMAKSTLALASELGYAQTILSASKKEYLDAQVQRYHISEYVDGILGIQDIYANSKQMLAQAFVNGCDADDEIWFIGDSIHDFEVAQTHNLIKARSVVKVKSNSNTCLFSCNPNESSKIRATSILDSSLACCKDNRRL